jgi:hypothetical protein
MPSLLYRMKFSISYIRIISEFREIFSNKQILRQLFYTLIMYSYQRPSQGRAALVALAPCPALPSRAGRNFFFKPCPGCPAGQGRAKFFALLTFLLKIVIHRFSS